MRNCFLIPFMASNWNFFTHPWPNQRFQRSQAKSLKGQKLNKPILYQILIKILLPSLKIIFIGVWRFQAQNQKGEKTKNYTSYKILIKMKTKGHITAKTPLLRLEMFFIGSEVVGSNQEWIQLKNLFHIQPRWNWKIMGMLHPKCHFHP